jgi:hypothetical protein
MLRGDPATAYQEYLLAAELQSLEPIFLSAALHPAARMGDVSKVRLLMARMDAHPDAASALPAADRALGRALIAALEGRLEEGLAGFRDALRRYREVGADMLAALAILSLVASAGPATAEIRTMAQEAQAVMERVRATAYLQQLESALAAGAAAPQPMPSSSSERSSSAASR